MGRIIAGLSLAAIWLAGAAGSVALGQQADSQQREEQLRLEGYDVAFVRLERPHTVRDSLGEERTYNEAFLVRLMVPHPGFWGERVNYFIGDFWVPEYGGWEQGVYFKVYERALFLSLDSLDVRYRIGSDGPVRSFDRTFVIGRLPSQPEMSEREAIGRPPPG
jgi:hypothetical protein